MSKKILMISGSPRKDGNTAFLVEWFAEGARSTGAQVDIVRAADLERKAAGCTSCRACQKSAVYRCVIKDEVSDCLARFQGVDVIVMASPLYFYGASSQLKGVMDRMFSLYKWDNAAGTMQTPLKGKAFVFLGSGYEDIGLDVFERPFQLTAEYTKMTYASLVVGNAGESGDIIKLPGVRKQACELGARIARFVESE
ncbi:MAG: flavodoxin family protein [Candidatus Omnitrophica bacterium]|nr:flavodoxin family protein [Candidatus Omnitrophota bacterium]